MRLRVVVASSPRSSPFSSLPRWNARKSEHCFPSTSITWMNSPARTSYASAVAASIADVQARLGERRRELVLLVRARRRAADLDEELGRGRGAVDDPPAGRGHDDRHRAVGPERLRRARRRPLAEEPDRRCLRRGRARARRARARAATVAVARARRGSPSRARRPSRRAPPRRRATARRARSPRRPARRPCRRPSAARPAPSESTVAPPGRTRYVSRNGSSGSSPRTRADGSPHAPAAGAFASISDASAMSFSASSRLPSASSFLTSFSTARRLYVWFQ